MTPTFETLPRFDDDYSKLASPEQARFRAKIGELFVQAVDAGRFPGGLRVKGVQGAGGIFEMTWAPNGRATFEYGPEQIPGQKHIIWRRVGGHEIFGSP